MSCGENYLPSTFPADNDGGGGGSPVAISTAAAPLMGCWCCCCGCCCCCSTAVAVFSIGCNGFFCCWHADKCVIGINFLSAVRPVSPVSPPPMPLDIMLTFFSCSDNDSFIVSGGHTKKGHAMLLLVVVMVVCTANGELHTHTLPQGQCTCFRIKMCSHS